VLRLWGGPSTVFGAAVMTEKQLLVPFSICFAACLLLFWSGQLLSLLGAFLGSFGLEEA